MGQDAQRGEGAELDKVYGNEKLLPVVTALGLRHRRRDFDLSKLRYGKVIIMADADVDGSHIRTLLLTFFFRFMRPLIEEGHVYLAQPPLFKLSQGKKVALRLFRRGSATSTSRSLAPMAQGAISSATKALARWIPSSFGRPPWTRSAAPCSRWTMADAERADEIFTILMGDKVAPRREFIEQNAKFVNNLDI